MNEPLEAPAGFVAHESSSRDMHRCGKCCGLGNDMACALLPCMPSERTDGKQVYFTLAVPAGD